MANPTDASPPPSSATTWPPLPTSAPKTIVIEKMAMFTSGDHLRVEDLSKTWDWIISPIAFFLVMSAFHAEEDYLSQGQHRFSFAKPFHHLWIFQSLHHYLAFQVLMLFLFSAFVGFTSWASYRSLGNGFSLFSRLTTSVCRGRRIGQVVSVGVPHALRDKGPYVVKCVLDSNVRSNFRGDSPGFTLRERENAVRFGQTPADFLRVPVVEV